jgi:hypothetical protein
LRVWRRQGAIGTSHDAFRVMIPHEGKFFFWLQRFSLPGGAVFSGFETMSPPLVLNPTCDAAHSHDCVLVQAQQELGPVKVVSTETSGSQLALHFATGSTIFIQRMRAAD